MGTAVGDGSIVEVAGTEVCVHTGVPVNGKTVCVIGSVCKGAAVNVMPGGGVLVGVRVGILGTQSTSPR